MIDLDKLRSFRIECDGELIVAIYVDGRVEFGENIDPDEAARIFWETVSSYVKEARYES